LRKNISSYTTRAVASNPSPVMNLKERIPGMTMGKFTSMMIDFFLERNTENELTYLTQEEKSEIGSLAESKYKSWEWNYAYGPEYQFNNSFEYEGKPHHCSLNVKDGIIIGCRIEGSENMARLGEKLTGSRHILQDVEDVLKIEKMNLGKSAVHLFF
jgi:lipoate-protein ligase A